MWERFLSAIREGADLEHGLESRLQAAPTSLGFISGN